MSNSNFIELITNYNPKNGRKKKVHIDKVYKKSIFPREAKELYGFVEKIKK